MLIFKKLIAGTALPLMLLEMDLPALVGFIIAVSTKSRQ
jgi:hypothetical protein